MNANTADASAEPITRALQRAREAFNAGRVSVVERECHWVLEQQPDNAEAWVLMSTVARHYQRLPEAVEMLRRAVALKPDNDYMQEALADLYLAQRDFRNAEPLYRRLLADRPKPVLKQNLGKCLWGSGRFDAALELFTEAAAAPDAAAATQFSLAQACISLARFESAHEVLTNLLKQHPTEALAWMLLGLLEFNDKRPQRALELIGHACKFPNAPARCHQLHAALLTLAGRSDAAQDARRKVPDTEEARAGWQSLALMASNAHDTHIVGFDEKVLSAALDAAGSSGATLEFGASHGRTLRLIGEHTTRAVHGFDPAPQHPAQDRLTGLSENITLHAGPFDETLPAFFTRFKKPICFAHLNSRSYESNRLILNEIREHLRPGSVLVLGEYMGYPGYEHEQFGAFRNWVEQTNLHYRYLVFSLLNKSVAIEVTNNA